MNDRSVINHDETLDAGWYSLEALASWKGMKVDELLQDYTLVFNLDSYGKSFCQIKSPEKNQ
jgi:hypothetical protein